MCHSNLPCLALLTLCSITFNSSIQQPHFHCRGWRSTNMSTQNMLSQMLFLQSQQQGYQWYGDKHGGCLCDVKLLHEPLESTIQNWTHRWMQIPMMLTENWMNENWLKFEWLWCFFFVIQILSDLLNWPKALFQWTKWFFFLVNKHTLDNDHTSVCRWLL